MSLTVHRIDGGPLPEALRERLAAAARLLLARHRLAHGDVAIVLAGDSMLQELNHRYRGLDCPTDVLSFPMLEPGGTAGDGAADHEEVSIGDIYISLERVREQAAAAGHSWEREVLILAIHGLLHLLGYDHDSDDAAATMQTREAEILNLVEQPPG